MYTTYKQQTTTEKTMTYQVKNTEFCKIIELKNNNKTDILSLCNDWDWLGCKRLQLNDVTIGEVEDLNGRLLIRIQKEFYFSKSNTSGSTHAVLNEIVVKNESEIIPTIIEYIKSNQG